MIQEDLLSVMIVLTDTYVGISLLVPSFSLVGNALN